MHIRPLALTFASIGIATLLAACGGSVTSSTPTASAAEATSAAASTSSATTCADRSTDASVQQVDTAGYRMVMAVGPAEAMYTQAQADASAPTTGEIMVAGSMMDAGPMTMASGSSMAGMSGSTSPGTRHVEVSICDLATGTTVTGADVTMTLASDGGSAQDMPVAEMRGVDEAATETHYGNNLPMDAMSNTVTFTIEGQTGTFSVPQ